MTDLNNIDYLEFPIYDASRPDRELSGIDFLGASLIPTDLPTVGSFDPAVGTAIGPQALLHFTVLPASHQLDGSPATLQRVMIFASFPGLNIYEVVHDGDAFSAAYPAMLGNTRVANGNGYDFALLRQEGWPASVRLVPVAVDQFGNINPISSEVYAWTLIT